MECTLNIGARHVAVGNGPFHQGAGLLTCNATTIISPCFPSLHPLISDTPRALPPPSLP